MKDGCQFIIVYEETEPVGFASFQHPGNNIYKLHKLYILQAQQGKGTGRFAIESVINEIKREGATALQLQVYKKNKAKEFYHKMGFEVIDEISLDIGNGFFMNDFIMEKKIN